MTESSFHFHKCNRNSGCRCWYKGFSSKFWADSHALIYTHCWADEVRDSHCYSWWRWWSDILWVPHKVMTTPLLCNLPSVVNLLCLYGQCCVEMLAGSSCLVTNFLCFSIYWDPKFRGSTIFHWASGQRLPNYMLSPVVKLQKKKGCCGCLEVVVNLLTIYQTEIVM
jgi:hypothetical protein